jgi:hypothetical protein
MRLDFMRALYEDPAGDFGARYVSVYLDTTPTSAGAATEVALRWRAAYDRLSAAGADAATLNAVAPVVTQRDHAVRGRVIFARGGEVRLEGALPLPPRQELASLAPLPHVLPWLAQLPARVPHVRVAAGRAGGQVLTVPGGVSGATARITTVEGVSWPVHKVSAGGWSEQRLQRSTEEAWTVTAKRIAGAAVAAAERVNAEFVVVGGDVRERSMVLDLLPSPLRESAVSVDREVAADDAAFDAEARAEEEQRAASRERALLDELAVRLSAAAEERRAVTGLAGTLTALRDGLVSDVLLIGEPSWVPDAVWIGPGLADAATERAALAERGVAVSVQARADAALARAAAGTGAELRFLSADRARPGDAAGEAADGIAALLRAPAAAL